MPNLDGLKPDPRNARRHSPRNVGMIRESIERNGFARSIVTANDGTVAAGNATLEAAIAAGIEERIVVESDGTKLIEVRRTDVEPGSDAFHSIAVSDNRTAELAETDAAMLSVLIGDALVDPSWMYDDTELDALMASIADPVVPIPGDVPSPQLRSESFVEIWCSADDLAAFRPTLDEWSERSGVTINVS